jgi:DNA-directed RNA polymerase subunit L
MNLNIISSEKNFIELSFDGDAHTILNIIKRKLLDNKDVEFVGYTKTHPLIAESRFVLRTKSSEPKKLIKETVDELAGELKGLSL